MIGSANFRLVQAVTLSATLLMSGMAMARDDTISHLTEHLRAVEALSAFGENLKVVVTTDMRFSKTQVAQWSTAVETAFDPDLLKADFHAALDSRLSEPVRQAALAYQTSPLGREVVERVANALRNADAPHLLDEAKAYIEQASDKRRALHEAQFEAESGAAQSSDVLDGYFRAMAIAATPILGSDGAEEWVASAQYLRKEYGENHFLSAVSVYSQMPEKRHEELVVILTTPEITEFYSVSTEALAETMETAIDRLEIAYADELNK
jgi:hypothetical protein